MEKRAFLVGLFAAVAASATLPAAEYFADAINGNDANDGLTEATAKLSLKEAIALASAGDTVTLLPGDYSNGTVTVSSTLSRAQITKPITLRSKNGRASRDVTRIVGKYDYEGGTGNGKTGGMGDNCVRGLWVTVDGAGSTIEGISFVDCSAPFLTGSGDATTGGGIYFANGGSMAETADDLYIVDCAFLRCQATRGAGTYGGTTVRCLFKSCRHTKYGAGQRAGSSYNSVFDDCHVVPGLGQDTKLTGGVLGYIRYVVNCTVVNCEPRVTTTGSASPLGVYNCVFQNNYDTALPQHKMFNCVTDTSAMTSNDCAVSLMYVTAEIWSPMDNDYRVNKGAKAVTTGSADWLSQIPAAYRDTDYYGNPRTTDGVVHCGAAQDVTEETGSGVAFRLADQGGVWKMNDASFNEGYRTWFQRTGWPFTVKVSFEPDSATRGVVRYYLSVAPYWPLQDDTVYLVPEEKHVKTMSFVLGNVVHVDPVAGDDANDGSENAPYRTLQKAVDCTAETLVLARAGDYAEGEAYWNGSNRVYVSTKKELRVKAVAGSADTFITGAADPDPAIANDYGLGPAALRCIGVATNAACCFQGFTLRNGHAGYNADNADSDAVHGAALLNAYGISSTYGGVLADCVITNCVSSRGVAFGGSLQRCRMTGCNVTKLGLLRSCRVLASVFERNPGGGLVVGQAAVAYNCTFAANSCPVLASGYGKVYGCVMGGNSTADVYGTFEAMRHSLYALKNVTVDESNVKETPIKFVSSETGDWRLLSTSAGTALSLLTYYSYNGYLPVTFDGIPFVATDGRIPAGAFSVRAVTTNYVDAVNGNDATADGTTEATAYKTLAAALAAAKSGDTVVALPGTYAEGSTVPTKTQSGTTAEPTIAARAVVPDFVTLESRDGPEMTVIEGARATVNANSYGCGSDAVRCVFLCANATVRGFTLYNGHTDSGGSSYADSVDTHGGGVSVANASSLVNGQNCFVENCTITNCAAARGGGGHCGTYRKCRFLDNNAPKPGVAIYFGVVEGCFLDNNSGHSIIYKSKVWNSTILGTQRGSSTSAVNNEGTSETRYPVVNTILGTSSFVSSNLVNCAYSSTARNRWPDAPNVNPAVGDLRMGPDGVPLAGSVAIDAGDASQTPASLGDTDLAGGQRVYNGAMDIGCFEFDWRPKYAAILGKGLAVTAASPEVYAVGESAVAVPGGSLEVEWANANGGRREFSGLMNVTGTGTLTAARGGEAFAALTSADGEQAFKFFSSDPLEKLSFAYAPGEGDTGAALLSAFGASQGLTIILR